MTETLAPLMLPFQAGNIEVVFLQKSWAKQLLLLTNGDYVTRFREKNLSSHVFGNLYRKLNLRMQCWKITATWAVVVWRPSFIVMLLLNLCLKRDIIFITVYRKTKCSWLITEEGGGFSCSVSLYSSCHFVSCAVCFSSNPSFPALSLYVHLALFYHILL